DFDAADQARTRPIARRLTPNLEPPAIHRHDRQVRRMDHRRSELLHHGELPKRLDLSVALIDALLADALGDAFHLLLGDLQAGQVEQILDPGGEGRVLDPGIDDLAQDLGAVGALINPQTLGLREKKRPDIGGSTASARSSGPCPRWWSRPGVGAVGPLARP